jgi:hypothetical protein
MVTCIGIGANTAYVQHLFCLFSIGAIEIPIAKHEREAWPSGLVLAEFAQRPAGREVAGTTRE